MGYRGRIISVGFLILILLLIRTVVTLKFGTAPHQIPLIGIGLVIIGWMLGREYDKSVYRANRDSLTRLYNRHYAVENVRKILSRADRKRTKVAILLIDVNDFKEINDTYGHEAGDRALINISDLLLNSFESSDLIARWGGDEFLIISPFTDETIVTQKIALVEKAMKYANNEYHNLSISIGKAVYPVDSDDFESLLAQADAEMYRFKSSNNQ